MEEPIEPERPGADLQELGALEASQPEDREFFTRPWSKLFSASLMAAYTALLCYFVINPFADTELQATLIRVVLGGMALWGASVTTRLLFRIRDKRPALTFTGDGIVDRTDLGNPVHVPWEQILEIRSAPSISGPFIAAGLEIKVLDPLALKLGWVRRLRQKLIKHTAEPDLVIGLAGLNEPIPDVIASAHEWNEARLLKAARAARDALPTPTNPQNEAEQA